MAKRWESNWVAAITCTGGVEGDEVLTAEPDLSDASITVVTLRAADGTVLKRDIPTKMLKDWAANVLKHFGGDDGTARY